MSFVPIQVQDVKLESTAKTIADELNGLNVIGAAFVNVITTLNTTVTALNDLIFALKNDQDEILALLTKIAAAVEGPEGSIIGDPSSIALVKQPLPPP
jgi:hypothetical protein